MAIAPYLVGNKWTIDKDPDDERYYVGDISNDLTDSGTTAVSVEAIVVGVEILEAAEVQGDLVIVKLGGLDVGANPVNFCTFRVTCANTEKFDRTIWFNRQDN